MNILRSMTIGSCMMLALMAASMASPNLSTDSASALPATTFFWGQSGSMTIGKMAAADSPVSPGVSASRNSGLENTKGFSINDRKSRVKNLSLGIARTEMFARNDRASFSLYAPTPATNRSLSFAKIISNSQMDEVWVTAVQALALAENRQLNTEFAYTVLAGKNGKFDSAISYRLIPITDSGKPGLAASLQYQSKF